MKSPLLILLLLLLSSSSLLAQGYFKTPSGEKYHRSSCTMVENRSKKLLNKEEIQKYGLTPCKICKPPVISSIQGFKSPGKGEGTLSQSVRCKGITQKGTRCQHRTRIANGYCYQHTEQNSKLKTVTTYSSVRPQQTATPTCGAKTKSGGSCRRKVKGGGRCYQHKI